MSLLDPRVWLALALALAASYGVGRWQGHVAERNSVAAEVARATAAARATEQQWHNQLEEVRNAKDAELNAVRDRLDAAVGELRRRPVRLPPAARPACAGATGAELSAADGEFLARLAARADAQRAQLEACQGWIDAVTGKP